MGTNRCICGLIKTPEHLLLSCKKIKEVKKEFKNQLNKITFNIKVLLHTNIKILNTLIFLQKTGIGTKKWHLKRIERADIKEE